MVNECEDSRRVQEHCLTLIKPYIQLPEAKLASNSLAGGARLAGELLTSFAGRLPLCLGQS